MMGMFTELENELHNEALRQVAELNRRLYAIRCYCAKRTHPGVVNSTSELAQHIIEMTKGTEPCE
jgi:hypothetical protein